MRWLANLPGVLVLCASLSVPTLAGPLPAPTEAAPESAWQGVITGQIEAFRHGDGATALDLSGTGFKVRYQDPEAFYEDLVRSGYEPLVRSRFHSFGSFERMGEVMVMQLVEFVGPDQFFYEALYQLVLEPEGWRVQSVMLRQGQGLYI